ncbi:hypothetical protein AB6D20_027455 (plasmid) [Vibrio splendidus]
MPSIAIYVSQNSSQSEFQKISNKNEDIEQKLTLLVTLLAESTGQSPQGEQSRTKSWITNQDGLPTKQFKITSIQDYLVRESS